MKSSDRIPASPSQRTRRTFSSEFKRDLVAQSMVPGASVSGIALANGINTNQLFAWRRQRMAPAQGAVSATLLPVHLAVHAPPPLAAPPSAHIEISFAHVTVRLHGQVDTDLVRSVLQSLVP